MVKNLEKKTAIEIEANEVRAKRNSVIEHLNNLELILSKNEFLGIKHRIESCQIPMQDH